MTDDAEEISLLDILVFFAEHWLLLILVPALVAAGAYIWAHTLPPTYRATVSITVPELDAPDAPTIDTRSFYRAVMTSRKGVETEISSTGATITAESGDAERASDLALAARSDAVDALIGEFEHHVATAQSAIAELDPVLNHIRGNIGNDPAQALALVQILDALGPFQSRLSQAAQGIEMLQTEPTVEVSRQGPRPILIGLLAGACAGALLLIFIATKKGLANAAGSEDGREKLQRIRSAFFLPKK